MKTIIAGSKTCTDMSELLAAIEKAGWTPTTVISGTAKGADTLGEQWAEENGVPVERFTPDWRKYGKAAGPIRNRNMAQAGEALIALWDGKSRGTKNMIETAYKNGLKVFVQRIKK